MNDQCVEVAINLSRTLFLPFFLLFEWRPRRRLMQKNETWKVEIVHQFSCQHLPQSSEKEEEEEKEAKDSVKKERTARP